MDNILKDNSKSINIGLGRYRFIRLIVLRDFRSNKSSILVIFSNGNTEIKPLDVISIASNVMSQKYGENPDSSLYE